MIRDKLQYLSDTIVIEQLASDPGLIKQAGLYETLGFDSIASAIKDFAKKHIRADAPGGYAGSIMNIAFPAVLFKIHPLLGIAAAFANQFGLNIVSIFQKVADAVGSGKVPELSTSGSESIHDLVKIALFGRKSKAGILERIFGNLSSMRGKKLALGIIMWFLKTLLIGAGLIAGAGLVKGLVMPDEDKKEKEEAPTPTAEPDKEEVGEGAPKVGPPVEVERPDPVSPTKEPGKGEKYFKNDSDNVWIVPLEGGSIDDTLMSWAVYVYPELSGYEDIIMLSEAFYETVSALKRNYSYKMPGTLFMPETLYGKRIHTVKQVVDTFYGDVTKLIKDLK